MQCFPHEHGTSKVVELQSIEQPIATAQEALDLIASISYLYGCNKIVVKREHFIPAFYQLRTGLAGEILQKFTNYHCAIAIAGDFTREQSKSLHDFMYECNRGKQVFFLPTVQEAIKKLHCV